MRKVSTGCRGVMIFQVVGTTWIQVKKWGNLWHVRETGWSRGQTSGDSG